MAKWEGFPDVFGRSSNVGLQSVEIKSACGRLLELQREIWGRDWASRALPGFPGSEYILMFSTSL